MGPCTVACLSGAQSTLHGKGPVPLEGWQAGTCSGHEARLRWSCCVEPVVMDDTYPMTPEPYAPKPQTLNTAVVQGFQLVGLEQTARSVPLQQHAFAPKTVLVLGKERDGISEAILQVMAGCVTPEAAADCCMMESCCRCHKPVAGRAGSVACPCAAWLPCVAAGVWARMRGKMVEPAVPGQSAQLVPAERQVLQMLDATVEIPQQGVIRSLNAHVSGGIAMYEYTRQLAAQAAAA